MIIRHNRRTDYNASLIYALHSVFWYQGLLDPKDEEWIDFPAKEGDKYGFSRPAYKNDSIIIQLINELLHKEADYTYQDVVKLCPEFASGKEFNVIWIILVEMFGSCGTSPRTGWIEKRQECADFLQLIVESEEWLYYNE